MTALSQLCRRIMALRAIDLRSMVALQKYIFASNIFLQSHHGSRTIDLRFMTIVLNLHPCKTFILIKRAIKKKFFISPIQLLILLKKYLNTKILLEFIFFIYSLFFIKNKIYFLSDSIFLLTRMKESTLNFVDDPCAVSSFFASQRSKVFTLFSDLVKK